MEYITKSSEETAKLAAKFLKENPETRVVGLSGDLGSGKSVFVKGAAKYLGIEKNITSPTFVIAKVYNGKEHKLVHIDAYRLKDENDLEAIGFNEFTQDRENYIFLEWPEQVFSEMPEKIKIIKFEYLGENERKISW